MTKIFLIGYMGSGKSTIAKALGKKLGMQVYDLDQLLEQKLQKSVAEIFQEQGEIYFRRQEALLFREMVTAPQSFILSLGGGTPCYANNHELLKAQGITSIYLKASVATLIERLKADPCQRPLLTLVAEADLSEYINKHLFDRSYYYHQAHYSLVVDHKSVETLVEEIITLIN